MLEMAVLGLLKEQPMHGYDLRKRLRGDFGMLASLSFGSLYPALRRLEAAGAVREVVSGPEDGWGAAGWDSGRAGGERRGAGSGASRLRRASTAEVIPLSGSLTGEKAAFRARLATRAAAPRAAGGSTRARKVYELTPRGEQLFETFLTEDPPRPEDAKAFALRWAFAGHLTPDSRLRLLERRRRQLEESLRSSRRRADSPPRPLDRFERSLVEHSNAAVQLDLDWIDQLIASERAAFEATHRADHETEVS